MTLNSSITSAFSYLASANHSLSTVSDENSYISTQATNLSSDYQNQITGNTDTLNTVVTPGLCYNLGLG